MATKDPRVDAYIAKSAAFARPILVHLRAVIHAACPDVEETMKWSFPHFQHHGILCSMAAFKEHCAFGFWKGALMVTPEVDAGAMGMGQFGRITSLKDLPAKKVLAGYVKQAMQLNAEGVKVPGRKRKTAKAEIAVPADFAALLKKNKAARTAFEAFSPSHRREYLEWITEAKQEATRQRRMATTLEWLAEGKSRNWKYEK